MNPTIISCQPKPLLVALTLAISAINKKHTDLARRLVHLEAAEGRVTFTGLGSPASISATAPATVALPADELRAACLTNPVVLRDHLAEWAGAETLRIEIAGSLFLEAGPSKARLLTWAGDDFPLPAGAVGEPIGAVNAHLLASMIDLVAWAAAKDDARPILTGVRFELAPTRVSLAAADGYRLNYCLAFQENGPAESWAAIVPAKALLRLRPMLRAAGAKADVEIYSEGPAVTFVLPAAALTTEGLEGEFPDVDQIVPVEYKTKASLLPADLLADAKAARKIAQWVTLKFEAAEGSVSLEATGDGVSYNAARAADIIGNDVEIDVGADYWRMVLEKVGKQPLALEMISSLHPLVFRFSENGRQYVHLLMPMYQPDGN